ncbi:MAG: FAD-dependent oxidoreductase [candidate division Zixibacteria bacterium]|nr:FAD-dependent oxidoreductase [candidate division Zixibacteria bacterium]
MANQQTGSDPLSADLLIVGGGISGITAAVEAAEAGKTVVLIEKEPYLGGRVAQMFHYFPKLCPPSCGLEINFRRIKDNRKIHYYTLSEVENVSGEAGNFEVTVKKNPRYVNENCTACGLCEPAVTAERDSDFDFGMKKTKAIYLPHEMAFPLRYVIDMSAVKDKSELKGAVDACPYEAIDLDEEPQSLKFHVAGVVWATGWKPYDAEKIENLNFGKYPNIITNMMMERIGAPNGPTEGKILRPSDQKEVKSVAFVQCAGSRDENHLPYCSGICCMASLKQATYVREQYEDSQVHIFFIDARTPGRLEDFYQKRQEDENIKIYRGKVAEITEVGDGNLKVKAENTVTGEMTEVEVEMVVLATGMVPNVADNPPANITLDDYGFMAPANDSTGIVGAGVTMRPQDVAASVQDGTGAVLKSLIAAARR